MIFLMLSTAVGVNAEPLGLADALTLEKEGDKAHALQIYITLAADLPPGQESIKSFEAILRLENGVDSLIRAAGLLTKKAVGTQLPAGLAEKYAGIAELAGDLETSAVLYRFEYAVSRSASALDSLAALCIEMNDLDGAELLLKGQAEPPRKQFLQAEYALQSGDVAGALKAVEPPAATASWDSALRALYVKFCAAVSISDGEAAGRAARQLAAAYPRSPEAAIALRAVAGDGGTHSRISASAAPGQFLGDPKKGMESSADTGSTPAPSSTSAVPSIPEVSTIPASPVQSIPTAPIRSDQPSIPLKNASIQTGSYLVRENADDMVRVLKEKGFPAVVRENAISGKTYFRALAVYGTDAEQAKKILDELKAMGFDGVLIFE
jgi:hypothetical protein